MYQMTPPQPPKPPKKKLNVLQWLIIIVVVGFAGWYLYTALAPVASPYAAIESGTLGAYYTGDCVIVRNESPYSAEGVTSITYEAEEGSTVMSTDTICYVYASGFSTKELMTLQDYRDQIRDYQKELLGSDNTTDAKMSRLESDVLARAKEVRAMIGGARGNLPNQEKLLATAIEARQDYIEEKYSTDQRLSRLYYNEEAQMQRIDSWMKQYAASAECIVSFYTDGYEYGLNAMNYDQFTPAEVRRMYNGQAPELTTAQKGKTTIYRTLKDGRWYVLFLSRDEEWNPVEGQTYELNLKGLESTTVAARVESFTRSGGELLVRLSVSAPVNPVLYMRTCEAELGAHLHFELTRDGMPADFEQQTANPD